jgi:hypothetical protein
VLVIPALRKLRQEDLEAGQAVLIARPCLQKKEKKKEKKKACVNQ